MRVTCHQVRHSMLWTVLVASAFSCSDTNGPETTDETCLHQLDTKPETATVVLGDSILFESTYLRACSITPPFIWSASPDESEISLCAATPRQDFGHAPLGSPRFEFETRVGSSARLR